MSLKKTVTRKDNAMAAVPRVEWDFDSNKDAVLAGYAGCPNDEIVYCYEYEYFRASGVSVFDIDEPQRSAAAPSIEKFYEEFITQGPPRVLAMPDPARLVPWLALDREMRRQKLEKVRRYEVPQPPPVSSVGVELLEKDGAHHDRVESHWFEDDDLNTVTIAPLRIAWKNTNDELVKAFRAWLTANRPTLPGGEEKTGKDSGTGMRAALKALGAWRLLRRMTIDTARKHTGGILGFNSGGLYNDAGDWSGAKGQAQRIIDARSNANLAERLMKEIGKSSLAERERALVARYLQTESRAVLLRLLTISPKLMLKRALLVNRLYGTP